MEKDYSAALNLYWNGRNNTAIEHLSKSLSDNQGGGMRFHLYRLWIEILSDTAEEDSLATLFDHLHFASLVDSENAHQYAALRGVIKYELGEVEIAQMLLDVSAGDYAVELAALMDHDVIEIGEITGNDYFVLKNLAHISLFNNDRKRFKKFDKSLRKSYENTPYEIHLKLPLLYPNESEVENLLLKAIDMFPMQPHYQCLLASMKYDQGSYQSSIKLFEKALEKSENEDFEVLRMLTHVCLTAFQEHGDEKIHSKYKYYHNLLTGDREVDHMQTQWLKKMSAHEYMNWRNGEEEDLDIVSGSDVSEGDMIFLSMEDYQGDSKLVGIYEATTDGQLDAMNGWVVAAKKLISSEVGIPIPVYSDNNAHMVKINNDSFEKIESAIEDFGVEEFEHFMDKIAG